MKTRAEEIDRIILWIILSCGLALSLIYCLSTFFTQPTVETITTNAPAANSKSATQEINFQPRKSK